MATFQTWPTFPPRPLYGAVSDFVQDYSANASIVGGAGLYGLPFGLFIGGLVALLIILYAGVPIV